MKKIYFIIFFFLIFSSFLNSKKVLIVEYTVLENGCVKKNFYDYTVIDNPYFIKKLKCLNLKFKGNFSIKKIINILKDKNVVLKSSSIAINNKLKDYVYLKNYLIIDSQYKVLEKNNEKYYIFNVCYPENNRNNKNFFQKIKEFFNE